MRIDRIIKFKEGERVIALIRHFPLVYLPKFLGVALLVAAPFFFMLPLFSFRPFGWPFGLATFWLLLFCGSYLGLRLLVIWYGNALIVTNRRVVDVNRSGLFDREVTEAGFDKIQDVVYQVKGLRATLFGYGTVVIQTAGAVSSIEMPYVRRPRDVHHLITEAMDGTAAGGRSLGNGLVDAAAGLSSAEARAFVVGLQQAVRRDDGKSSGASAQALAESEYFSRPQVTEEVGSFVDRQPSPPADES